MKGTNSLYVQYDRLSNAMQCKTGKGSLLSKTASGDFESA